jgi:hypothetical protein
MRTATVAVNSAAPTAISMICHSAIPPVATVWTTVRPSWDTAGSAPAGDGTLPLAYDRKPTIKANADGAKKAKLNKPPQIAIATLAVRRTKWMWFMTTSLAMWNDSVWNYEQAQRRRAIR